jgi:TonB-dependent SusC/RagA subfamily outer membrane receptor
MLYCLALASTVACQHRTSAVTPAPADDTVATGYGTQSRDQVGGAVQTIGADELANTRAKRVEELLAGRVAGLRVIPTANGGFIIRIRGTGSLTGETDPLYVVDGMVVQVEPGQGLNWLNPAEIERIDVLKDAAETSIYGVRGANGVILIKTKRGSR